MSVIAYKHGSSITTISDRKPIIAVSELSPVGIIIIAEDADSDIAPENTAIHLPDFKNETLEPLGSAKRTVETLKAQGIEPKTVIVRAPEGADAAETEQNIIAGLQVLKNSANQFGFDVKLLIAPGLETVAVNKALETTAEDLGAQCYFALNGAATKEDAKTLRENFSNRHGLSFWPATVLYNNQTVHAAALAVSLRVLIDSDTSGKGGLGRSISNWKMKGGIDNIGMPIDYKAENSIANDLNKHHINTFIRKSASDFRIYGGRTNSIDPMWIFEPASRVSEILKEKIDAVIDEKIDDKSDIATLEDVQQLIQIEVFNREKGNLIIDGKFWLNTNKTTADESRQGRFHYKFKFGVYIPFEQVFVEGEIVQDYLIVLLSGLNA